jgi:Circadian oscillating protein COP23
MKSFFLPLLLLSTALMTSGVLAQTPPNSTAETASGTVTFSCSTSKDPSSRTELPATVAAVSGSSESTVLIIWKSEFFGAKYTPQQRCEIVSAAIQKSFQEGRIYLGSGTDKSSGLGVICAVADPEKKCDRSNMLFTLKSYQNADDQIQQLGMIMQGKTGIPLYQSSGGRRVNMKDLLLKSRSTQKLK